jgi:hypothetical protein
MRLQVVRIHRKAQPFDTAKRAQHFDAVVQMHQAEQWEGKSWAVINCNCRANAMTWIGRRQAAIIGKVAEPSIGVQIARLNPDETAQAIVRQVVAADGALAGCAQVQAGARSRAVQVVPVSAHAQAPINAWPHTRSTWPLTARSPAG